MGKETQDERKLHLFSFKWNVVNCCGKFKQLSYRTWIYITSLLKTHLCVTLTSIIIFIAQRQDWTATVSLSFTPTFLMFAARRHMFEAAAFKTQVAYFPMCLNLTHRKLDGVAPLMWSFPVIEWLVTQMSWLLTTGAARFTSFGSVRVRKKCWISLEVETLSIFCMALEVVQNNFRLSPRVCIPYRLNNILNSYPLLIICGKFEVPLPLIVLRTWMTKLVHTPCIRHCSVISPKLGVHGIAEHRDLFPWSPNISLDTSMDARSIATDPRYFIIGSAAINRYPSIDHRAAILLPPAFNSEPWSHSSRILFIWYRQFSTVISKVVLFCQSIP